MNYSTLKKTAALSIVSLMAVGAANAQMSSDTSKMASTSAKIFGGSGQYRTWTIGVNAGVTSEMAAIGGINNFNQFQAQAGYEVSLRKQLAHSFGIEADYFFGKIGGTSSFAMGPTGNYPKGISSFSTQFYSGSINGVVNVATIDYLRRKNAINFFVSAGASLINFAPMITAPNGTTYYFKHDPNVETGSHAVTELSIPVGLGVKFRLSDAIALNLGYKMYFMDADNLDGVKGPTVTHRDKYTFGYGGLEYTFGSKSKPNLEWVNPVAMMYDELNDPTLKQEVEALKGRVSNVEKSIDDLKKDSDGDGVADQFDKCPNTPAGTVVDGSGCPIKMPAPIDTSVFMRKDAMMGNGKPMAPATAYANIQFEFDSSVLRTSSYPILDATSAAIRSAGKTVTVNGFASSEGTPAHNMRLSKDRANSVKTYLVNSGVDAKKVKVKGYGETKPVADNSTEDGRVLNRRVEFKH